MSEKRILVIDDSKEIARHLTQQLLPNFGYKTLQAFDGRTGLDIIRQEKPDLVMLDLHLPEMTGLDVLQVMANESIEVPVVLMTGFGSEKNAIEAFRLGIKDYLVKPFTIDEVVSAIRRALEEEERPEDSVVGAIWVKDPVAAEAIRRQNEAMKMLFGVGKAVTSLLGVDQILDRVLEGAIALTGAEDSIIWLPDREGNMLQAFAKKRGGNNPDESLDLPFEGSHAGKVMQTGRPLREYVATGAGFKVKTGYLARAVMHVPLMVRGKTLGVLSATNRYMPRAFSEHDEYMLSALSDYAAIALQNAEIFQATDRALAAGEDELRTLIRITRILTSTLNLDEIVRLTIQQVHDSWQLEASSLWLVDENTQTMRLLDNVGTPRDVLRRVAVPMGEGIVGHVAQAGEAVMTNDVANHPTHFRSADELTGFNTRSILCVPLVFRRKVIGALQLLNKSNGDFDEQDLARAKSLAATVAIAVSNALLFRRAESRQQHLEATLEHNGNPVIITDRENRLTLLNQQARLRLGLTNQAIGKAAADMLKPEALAEFLVKPGDDPEPARTEVTFADKSVWLCTLARIPKRGRILVLQDITYLKRLDEAKSNFVATVSHDLRAPLNSISSFAQALSKVGPVVPEQQVFVDRIMQASERMAKLVNDLLDLAQVNTKLRETREPCDILPLVHDVIGQLRNTASEKGVTISLVSSGEQGKVFGDQAQLRRAVKNLVDHAISYSPEGERVQVQVQVDESAVQVRIRDQGEMIPATHLPYIFSEFYRLPGEDSSHGVVLALVRSIAEAHGGKVWAESGPELGNVFSIQLPLAQPD